MGPVNILGRRLMQVFELAKSLANRSASELKVGAFLVSTRIVNLVKPRGDYLANRDARHADSRYVGDGHLKQEI